MIFIRLVVLATCILFLSIIPIVSAQEWRNTSWVYRDVINILNIYNNQPLVKNYTVKLVFDHASLVSQGKSLVNGDDVRVVFNNIELDRINITPFNRNNTAILFMLQENISANSLNNTAYYLYYGNFLSANPPTNKTNIFKWNPILNPSAEYQSDTSVWTPRNWSANIPAARCGIDLTCNGYRTGYHGNYYFGHIYGGWNGCDANTYGGGFSTKYDYCQGDPNSTYSVKWYEITNVSFYYLNYYCYSGTPNVYIHIGNVLIDNFVANSGSWTQRIINISKNNFGEQPFKFNGTGYDCKPGFDYIRVSYDNGNTWLSTDSQYLYPNPEPTITLGSEETTNYKISISVQQSINPNKDFSFVVTVRNATSGEAIVNLVQGDFSVQKEGEQINFGFANLQNGSYSLTVNSGNLLGNVSYKICAKGACEEKYVKISIGMKDKTAFIATDWQVVLNSGITGKPLFRNYSETAKNFLSKYKPEQVFIMENTPTDFSAYRFKDISAMVETFFSGAILVKTKEQVLAAAPLAKLKNYGILFDNQYSGTVLNLTDKSAEQINDLVIKEARLQGKNINTIIIANPNSESSGLAGIAAAKYDSLMIPLQFSQPNYPASVNDFYQTNLQNGVIGAINKINQTTKKLNSNFMFANNLEYKLGKQLNLILLGNMSEVPHGIVFDAGMERFGDIDGNILLTDYLYSDLNKDGKADLMTGRVVSEYQMLDGGKEKKIVTAALYRNLEFAYSGNGLLESMSTDTAFRNAGFSAVRLIENHTNLSYYSMSASSLADAIAGFLKELWKTEDIVDTIGILFRIYGTYEEFLEHNLYRLMNTMEFGLNGATLHFFPDERLEKQRLVNEMRSADGIFYYGKGNESAWLLPDENNNYKIAFEFGEFPVLNLPFVYNEYNNAMRGEVKEIFEKGAAAIAGPTGVVHDAYAFAFNSKLVRSIARNFSVAQSIENAKFLTNQEIKNLTEIISFSQTTKPQPSVKQYLQTVLYAEPEFKIDPNYTEAGANPEISYNGSFVARIKIPVNYTVLELNGTSLILFDAEQYLQEFYKPIIPVYTKEFLLPNGSQILGISVSYNTTNYTNVFVPILMPDVYYQQENKTQEGFYPDKNFENTSFELLDGRRSLLLTAMPLRYNNQTKQALVFEDIEFTIIYTSPLEMLDFSAKDIKLGDEEMFLIKVKNAGNEKNITIALEIEGETIFEDYIITANAEKTFFVSYKPAKSGAYTAKAFLLFENNSVGPRYANFHVSEKNILESMAVLPFKIFKALSPTKTEKTYKTALEKLSISKQADLLILEYSAPQIKFISKSNATTIEKLLMKPGYRLEVIHQNGRVVQRITTSDGLYSVEKNFGTVEEKCKGNCELMKIKLAETIAEMNYVSVELQEKIK